VGAIVHLWINAMLFAKHNCVLVVVDAACLCFLVVHDMIRIVFIFVLCS